MDAEVRSLIKVWSCALISISYCYYIASRIPRGVRRLLSVLPVFCLFLVLPLDLSCVHFCGITAFFLSWLANFRLLLFAFDQGPLSSPLPNLFRFICFACLPIKPKQAPPRQNPGSSETKEHSSSHGISSVDPSTRFKKFMSKWVLLAIKAAILGVLFHGNDYIDGLPQIVVLALYCLHIYLELELVLVFFGVPVSKLFGFEIEPQFDEPYLATSLQDFWSRRWNLMVPGILRPTVHVPVRRASAHLLGPKWAALPGVLAAFLVSGLMHELIFFYMSRVPPTWEVTWFFVLHGVCTAVEIAVKKTLVGWRLDRVVSGLLAVGFVSVTGGWLFFPQLLRNDVHERVISEGLWVFDIVKAKLLLSSWSV